MKAQFLYAVLVMIASCIAAVAADRFDIATQRTDDVVDAKLDQGRAVFDIKSPFGISHATITRKEAHWPASVVLRLHLAGLEDFQVTSGKLTLHASVSGHDGKPKVRVWKNDKENEPLDANSPDWLEVRALNAEGKPAPAIPLKDGVFDIALPKNLFDGNPEAITVRWIDFYRQ